MVTFTMSRPELPDAEIPLQHITSELAGFGRIGIERGLCAICNVWSFIQDNQFIFCGHEVTSTIITVKQEFPSDIELNRKYPNFEEKEKILKEQRFRCAYCDREFGTKVKLVWDHFLPFSIYNDNSLENFVASCKSCNSIKHNKVFNTINEVREYVKKKREVQGTKNLSRVQDRVCSLEKESNILHDKMSMECVEQTSSTLLTVISYVYQGLQLIEQSDRIIRELGQK